MKKLVLGLLMCMVALSVHAQIQGSKSVCPNTQTTFSDKVQGGTWSSPNTNIAVIGSSLSNGVSTFTVNATAGGQALIIYSAPNSLPDSATITVSPVISPLSIVGTQATNPISVCVGDTVMLGDPIAGGAWSKNNSMVTIGTTGIVTGVSQGTSIITYGITGCPKDTAMVTVTVSAMVSASISTSAKTLYVGTSANLSSNGAQTPNPDSSNASYPWANSNSTVATITVNPQMSNTVTVTGVAAGTATIFYTVSPGCYATTTMTVNSNAAAPTLSASDVMAHMAAVVDSDKAESIAIGHINLTDTAADVYSDDYMQYRHDSEKYHNCKMRIKYKFAKHEGLDREKYDNASFDTFKILKPLIRYPIGKVELNVKNGYINNARVTLKDGSKDGLILSNSSIYYSIPYVHDNVKSTMLCNEKGDKCMILNDIISYRSIMNTKNYTPNDDTVTLIPNTNASVPLSRNIDLNSNIDFRIYTDLLGVINKQSNGLVQAEATTNIFINGYTTTMFKTCGLVFANFIQPSFSYSKFANQSNALNLSDSSQPLQLSDSQRVALYQLSYLQLGVKLNIAKLMFGSNFVELNGGMNYNFSNVQLGNDVSNLKTYNTWSGYSEIAAELLNTENFGMDVYIKLLWQNTVNTSMLVSGYQDFYVIPQICMFYYPGDNKSSKIFLKLNLTQQESASTHLDQNILDYKRGFISLQVGYSAKLKI